MIEFIRKSPLYDGSRPLASQRLPGPHGFLPDTKNIPAPWSCRCHQALRIDSAMSGRTTLGGPDGEDPVRGRAIPARPCAADFGLPDHMERRFIHEEDRTLVRRSDGGPAPVCPC